MIKERGRLRLDTERMTFYLDGEPLALTRRGYDLLKLFLNRTEGHILDYEQIGQELNHAAAVTPVTVRAHVYRVNKVVGEKLIKMRIGFGYYLDAGENDELD